MQSLPLNDGVVITCGAAPPDTLGKNESGGWDVLQKSQQARKNREESRDWGDTESEGRVWVQISTFDSSQKTNPGTEERFELFKIVGK